MDLIRSVTQTVLGGQNEDAQPSGAETVERLLDRVQSSTLLEDRRDACRALKSLAKRYKILVGAHGMDTLIQVLETDRNDHDIVNYALETLMIITSTDSCNTDETDINEVCDSKVGEQFSEIFIKREENIGVVMSMLDEFDFKVCYPAMKLLKNLLQNRPKELQEAILVMPNGISKLMDMLTDNREVIRNDVLLILTELSRGNANTQKIIVFENAYDHLFNIIRDEEYGEGGVVVEDCLILMLNLLKNNSSNQTLFKEGNYMQKVSKFFVVPVETEIEWNAQRLTNVHYMLEVIRSLVSPQNTAQITLDCQNKIHGYGILSSLCLLLMRNGVPAEILTDTINTIADLIRGNKENQQFFSTVTAPSNPPRPVIVVLLMSMVNDKQPFLIRCAVLYCFQCFLYRNTSGQAQIVQTLLPHENQTPQMTAGQLLCGGLFAQDSLSNWFCAIALAHALLDNTAQKEQLLRAQLAPVGGSLPVSLLQQCVSLLQGGSKFQTRISLLQLLCVWIVHCPVAVNQLLSIPSFVPYLTAFVSSNEHDEMEVICQGVCAFLLGLCAHFNDGSVASFTRQSIGHLVSNRVGVENFTDKLANIMRTEANSRAAKSPHIRAKQPVEMVLDHEFTRLFKSLEVSALKAVTADTGDEAMSVELKKCKELLCSQDVEMENLKKTVEKQSHDIDELKQANESMALRLAEAQTQDKMVNAQDIPADIVQLQQQLAEMTYARDYYYYQMVEKDNLLQTQTQESVQNKGNPENELTINLRKQLEDFQLILHQKDEEIRSIKEQNIENSNSSDDAKVFDLQQQSLAAEKLLKEKLAQFQQLNQELNKKIVILQEEKTKIQSEFDTLSSEQEDVFVLLGEQEAKIADYRSRLIALGQPLSDEENIDDLT